MITAINPYLNFSGNAEEAFNFYRSIFGGEFAFVQRFKEVPGMDKIPEDARDKLMHVSLPLGKGNLLMASDAMESMGQTVKVGNNVHLALSAESKAEADKLFAGLSSSGKVHMPMADQFWGDYFGMCADKFGIQWMISFTPPK